MAQVVLENVYKSFPVEKFQRTVSSQQKLTEIDPSSKPVVSNSHQAVLRRINLTVSDGEFMVLVGPSGCGKSTLLRLISGLETLTGGNIYINQNQVNDLPPKARDIAMVFQNYALYPHLTVYDNLAFGLRRTEKKVKSPNSQSFIPSWIEDIAVGMTRSLPVRFRYQSQREKAISQQVLTVGKLLQIESLLQRYPKQLSGGQKQRVALGRAMARNPQVFLMDEPLSNLDAKLRTETRAQIVELQRKLGITTIYVTHDQVEAMTMGSRIAVMNQGQIQQVAPPLELYNYPANRFVAEFIGSPPMNFLTVQLTASLFLNHPLFHLNLPQKQAVQLKSYPGKSLILGIRPEHLNLSNSDTSHLKATVDWVEALGHETLLSVCLSSGEKTRSDSLQIRVPGDAKIKQNEQIGITINLDKIHLFDPETEKAIF